MKTKKISTIEASCIITGYGIGSGVLSLPMIVQKNGIYLSIILLVIAFAASILLHMMIADVINMSETDGQINSVLSKFLFRGKAKKAMSTIFFALIAFICITNLSIYIIGSSNILTEFLQIPETFSNLIIYVVSAIIVLLGLKSVGISEKIAVLLITVFVLILSVASLTVKHNVLPLQMGTFTDALTFFSIAMLSFSAFFSVPQVWVGLNGDMKKVKKAIILGLTYILIIISSIVFFSLIASDEITEVCIVGWCSGLGTWAEIFGGFFTVLAMLTTYWSLSLAFADIIKSQFKLNIKIGWFIATLPSFIFAIFNLSGFLDTLQFASGGCAVAVIVLFVPTFVKAKNETMKSCLGIFGGLPFIILVSISYILMAIGSFF